MHPRALLLAAIPALLANDAITVLEKRCAGCHSGPTKRGGLDVTSRAALLSGGSRGPAIEPGNAKRSLLYLAAAHQREPHMPMGAAKLPDAELDALATWIDSGAAFERAVSKSAPAKHWAFQEPRATQPPAAKNAAWIRNPIDAFVASARDAAGLTAAPEATRRTLIRRAYLDLLGVPPTPAESAAFVADPSPDAYDRLITRLLDDPRYGERWGRHWMDVWRYSDWYGWRKGNDVRFSAKHIWRWRDWIVDSLNSGKGYDRMIVEMLAGDEVAPADPDTVRATGFLARQYHKYDRDGWLQDAVDHTAMGFLGVTVKCARCHDHKYDPVSQQDYYAMRAMFEPYDIRTDRVPGETDTGKNGVPRVYDAEAERPTYLLIRGEAANPDKSRSIEPGVPSALGGVFGKPEPLTLPVTGYYPDIRDFVHTDLVAKAKADAERAEAALRKAKETTGDKAATPEKLLALDKAAQAAKAYIPALEARIRADKAKYADPQDPKFEEISAAAKKAESEYSVLKADAAVYQAMLDFRDARASAKAGSVADMKKVAEAGKSVNAAKDAMATPPDGYTPVGQVYPDRSSGRRTALAKWIASDRNPLTARVAINHMWMRHFGQPLVSTVFDFGLNGKRPTHPELLDWLAVEFMKSGWSMKHMHRLMMTSSTYRMTSTASDSAGAALDKDPGNTLLWRMNSRRMEAEIVRDSMLSVSGKLDPKMGGPEIEEKEGFKVFRRSIYFQHSPDTQMEFLRMFDNPNPAECYARNESVVPQQALALANSELTRDRSRELAKALGAKHADAREFVTAAFETVLGRPPSAKEMEASLPASRENLVHVLFNHNDFITIR